MIDWTVDSLRAERDGPTLEGRAVVHDGDGRLAVVHWRLVTDHEGRACLRVRRVDTEDPERFARWRRRHGSVTGGLLEDGGERLRELARAALRALLCDLAAVHEGSERIEGALRELVDGAHGEYARRYGRGADAVAHALAEQPPADDGPLVRAIYALGDSASSSSSQSCTGSGTPVSMRGR